MTRTLEAPDRSRLVGRLQILASAALFSTGGAAIKATTLTSWQVAGLRAGVAFLFLIVVLPAARRRWGARTWLVGAAYAGTIVIYVQAMKLTTAGATIFLQSTAPIYVLILAPLLLREPIRRRQLLLMGAAAVGLALFFVGNEPAQATAPRPLLGNALAALCGVTWALTILGLRLVAARGAATGETAEGAVVVGNLIACLVCLPKTFPLAPPGALDWAMIVFLGVFQIGAAYVLLVRGLSVVPAFEASLLVLLEPVMNPVWTWLVHGERLGRFAIAGGSLILGATLTDAWSAARDPRGDRPRAP